MAKARARAKKTVRKTSAKKTARKVVKAVKKTMKKRAIVKKVAKNVTKKIMAKASKPAMAKGSLGRVVHYYDRISVAILELNAPLSLGDMVRFQRGDLSMMQQVDSLQIDHTAVDKAKKGAVVGMKVQQRVESGTMVFPG